MSERITDANHKWIYTYDYAPDSVWEKWREEEDEPAWILPEATVVAQRVRENGKLPSYILLADSHFTYHGTWDDTATAMRALKEELPELRGIIHLGDLSDGLLPLVKTQAIEKQCIRDMKALGLPIYLVPGNHDYNYFRKNPEVRYPDVPRFYVDETEPGFRMIFLDSFDPGEAVRYGFSQDCISWLDRTLTDLPEAYRTIIFAHVPPLVRLQAWAKDIRNRESLMEVLNRHSTRILAFINGHNHCDLLFNDLYNGQFPVISINCAKCEYFTEHKPVGAYVPERKLGDRTQESFDILQVDAGMGKLYFTRFGAGKDRAVEDHRAFWIGGSAV